MYEWLTPLDADCLRSGKPEPGGEDLVTKVSLFLGTFKRPHDTAPIKFVPASAY